MRSALDCRLAQILPTRQNLSEDRKDSMQSTITSPAAPSPPASYSAPSIRVLSIDVLRGITIAFMILVNDPGDWAHTYAQLDHAPWNGFTLTDLVFPNFLFLVGASIILSAPIPHRRAATSIKRAN